MVQGLSKWITLHERFRLELSRLGSDGGRGDAFLHKLIENLPHPGPAGSTLKTDFPTLGLVGLRGTGARGLDGVGDLIDSGLPLLSEVLANENAVEERSRDEDRDARHGTAVGVEHAHVWVSVDLPDPALHAVIIVVECSEKGPVGVSADLGLADHPQGLVSRRGLGSNRWSNLPPLVWVVVADVRAGVAGAVVHLEGLGFDDPLDRANFAVIVGIDSGELAGAVSGYSGAVLAVLISAILADAVLTSTVLAGDFVSAVDFKVVRHGAVKRCCKTLPCKLLLLLCKALLW